MNNFDFAPRLTPVSFSSDSERVVIANGDNVRVWSIWISNPESSSNSTIEVESADGSVSYMHLLPGVFQFDEINKRWIADKGLSFRAPGTNFANLQVLVFHSHPGT